MRLEIISEPSIEPITVSELQNYLKLDKNSCEDGLLTTMITAARQVIEEYTGRRLITQTIEQITDYPQDVYACNNIYYGNCNTYCGSHEVYGDAFYSWPTYGQILTIIVKPVQSVSKIEYIDTSNTTETWDSDNYIVDGNRIKPDLTCWPVNRNFGSIIVTFVAGYGDTAPDIPAPIKLAILKTAGHLYQFRYDMESQNCDVGSIKLAGGLIDGTGCACAPFGVNQLLRPYKSMSLGGLW